VLHLYDTALGEIVPIEPRRAGELSIYVCGPTVYDVPHLGHGRAMLVYDVLRRYLEARGVHVVHVSNVTDVDDKILERAAQEDRPPAEVAGQFEQVWWDASDRLGVLRPTHAPRAAELVDHGVAYEAPSGVYMEAEAVPGYGLLALQDISSLQMGARVELEEGKRSPIDFALWKRSLPGELSWPSPWGPGRPGWHTECVVMSLDLLGEGFDLHAGGLDLRFPHHENERAQAVALGRQFARHWMHHGFVEVQGEKMSKSLGNFTSLTDLLERTDPRAYRLLVLRSHYRKPLEVTPATMADAKAALARLDALVRRFPVALTAAPTLPGGQVLAGSGPQVSSADLLGAAGASWAGVMATQAGATQAGATQAPSGDAERDDLVYQAIFRFCERMEDDLDTPGALSQIFELIRAANAAADRGEEVHAGALAATVVKLARSVGIEPRCEADEVPQEVMDLLGERDHARSIRDFAVADAIRDRLKALGWVVEDGPSGTRLRRSGT